MTDGNKTTPQGDINLDDFFAAARAEPPQPSADFMMRIEADALAERPSPERNTAAPKLWRTLLQAVGGWTGAAGLATACATGIWIGVAPPQSLTDIWALSAGLDQIEVEVDPLSGFDYAMMEG